MIEFNFGSEATRGSGMPFEQTPIHAECFLPPRVSCPRAWQRVAVAPVPGLRRQPKIWKRVGGVVTASEQEPYARAMAELEQQSQGPRKRARHARHIPAWGDARWDPRAEETRDGQRDLDEARVTVSHAEEEAPTTDNITTKRATFPEESLKWVPRKRHNSRWPIEPKKESVTRMVADLQPFIDFEVPASPEPVEVMSRMDEKQMRRRSTRRLSRRFSLIPGEESPRKLPMVTLSHADNSAPAHSPIKRPPVTMSPTKVADSPARSFRINATPTKVVLETPKAGPPAMSPAKPCSSPIAPTTPAAEVAEHAALDDSPASPAPLLFDQPSPVTQAEPQHETRRRVSLQAARRCERGSSGASRLLALKKGRNSPNRRHSFTSLENLPADARGGPKGRRNTMDGFCVGPPGLHGSETGDEAIVEIDMKTSLDIFSQPTKAAEPAPRRRSNADQEDGETQPPLESESTRSSTAVTSPVNDKLVTSDVFLSPLPEDPFGVTEDEETGVEAGMENASPHQAATSPSAGRIDVEDDFTPEPSPRSSEEPTTFPEGEQDEVMFVPHDPEGLSTIYEESSMFESHCSEDAGVEEFAQGTPLDASLPCSVDEKHSSEDDLGQAPSTPDQTALDMQLHESSRRVACSPPVELNRQTVGGSVPESHVSASHVANTADAMSSPDSPQLENDASPVELPQQSNMNPLSGPEGPIATPPADDVFSGPVFLDLETKSSPATSGKQPGEMLGNGTLDTNSPLPIAEGDGSSLPVTAGQGSPRTTASAAPLPGTPTTLLTTDLMQRVVTPEAPVDAAAAQESSGFTPINGRQISPPNVPPSGLRDDEEAEADLGSDDLDADEVVEEELADEGCEATIAMDEDMTVEAPRPQFDTLQLHARRDDSETEMLRNFVTRVTADKNAKAAAAAAAIAKKSARRSGSLSITSSTGSPMAKAETPASRTPLGVKSPNSPSPAKKRKLELMQDDLAKDNDSSRDSTTQPSDGPRLKRRRKRGDPVLEAPVESSTPSPEPDSAASGPRRSTRARSTRIALRPTAPSANAIAFSMIPVRLPGMGAMDEVDSHIAGMARQRSEEKDLAAVTRGNTRKNKGGAVPPQVVLAKQAEDPSWRMRELKGVFEAKERRARGPEAGEGAAVDGGEKKKGNKGVKWAEELVRFQTEAEPSVFKGMASQLLADVVMMDDGVDEIAEAEPPAPAEPVVEKTARVAARKAASSAKAEPSSASTPAAPVSTRRTRSSRLPPPTPVKKMQKTAGEKAAEKTEKPAAAPSLRTRAKSLPKLAPAPTAAPDPAPVAAPAKSAAAKTGMSTRRTRISKLGMSGNGTPAPKRRGRTAL